METDTKHSWKKRAAIATIGLAALAATFKLGYDTHKPQPKIEVRTQTNTRNAMRLRHQPMPC